MEKKLKIAFGLVSLSLIAIVAFQLYWTVNAYYVNKKTFENKTDIAMQQALDSCKKTYFDSIRIMMVKRLSDTSQIKIKVDTTSSTFTDAKGPFFSYNFYINTPTGDRLGLFSVNKTITPLGMVNRPAAKPVTITTKEIFAHSPKFFVGKNGTVITLTKPGALANSTVVIPPKKTINAQSSYLAIPDKSKNSIDPASGEILSPTMSVDNRRWDFYKRMIKHKATVPEVLTEMSFYVPITMQSLWWALASADMRDPVNKAYMKVVMDKYKGAARDTFFAHGGQLNRRGIGVLTDDYIKIEHYRIQKYFAAALKGQHINAPFYLNLSESLAPIIDSSRTSKTTWQEYKYYGMRIFGLSANKPPLFVEAVFTNSEYAVLKAMAFTLIASVLLIILTAVSFMYTIRIILHQKKLADLKDDFINNMTHELKTPIATITVAIEGLQAFNALSDPEKTQRYLQTSRNELSRLNDLVTKVLNIATFENKDIDLHLSEINIDELINDLISAEKAKAVKTVNITYHNKDQVPFIHADQFHFRNLLTNLLDNAVKYSGDPVDIEITCYQQSGQVCIAMKDNGIGIAPADLQSVFDKFYRVPTGNVHNIKGTGLGLSYVKFIAEAHGGSVEVKSEIGLGTEFIVSLPLSNG
jgi:signal transduction histidine kinase